MMRAGPLPRPSMLHLQTPWWELIVRGTVTGVPPGSASTMRLTRRPFWRAADGSTDTERPPGE